MEDDEEPGSGDEKKPAPAAGDATAALAQQLKRAQREARENANELQRYRQAEADKKAAEQTDLEKANARIAELEGKIAESASALASARRRSAFELAAQKAGVVDVEVATMLANLDDLEVAEDGSVTGTDELMKALQAKRPFLFGDAKKEEPSAFGGGGNTGGAPGVRLYSSEEIAAMDAATFAKFDADVAAGRARPK